MKCLPSRADRSRQQSIRNSSYAPTTLMETWDSQWPQSWDAQEKNMRPARPNASNRSQFLKTNARMWACMMVHTEFESLYRIGCVLAKLWRKWTRPITKMCGVAWRGGWLVCLDRPFSAIFAKIKCSICSFLCESRKMIYWIIWFHLNFSLGQKCILVYQDPSAFVSSTLHSRLAKHPARL